MHNSKWLLFIATVVFLIDFAVVRGELYNLTTSRINDWVEIMERLDNYKINKNMYNVTFHKSSAKNHKKEPLGKLFTYIHPEVFKRRTIVAFIDLMSEYDPVLGHEEKNDEQKRKKIDAFVHAVMESSVMKLMLQLLKIRKIEITQDLAKFREWFKELWFTEYPRKDPNGVKDSSAFEHVFLGEFLDDKVLGMHNWIRFALLEQKNEIEYLGYRIKKEGTYAEVQFKWNGVMKVCSAMFLKTTPEFDMAFLTMSYLVHPTKVKFRGCWLKMAWYDLHIGNETFLSTVFPKPGNKCDSKKKPK
ncbi:placental protein 11 [Trichuris trichiura]|uniref:Placental protein 11 n=1 Tax=Trichuris trichiura TaxID=36087 RepID=A0A077ZDR5_TRITR|nr:placental protein 11 [Trichuris trichiura]